MNFYTEFEKVKEASEKQLEATLTEMLHKHVEVMYAEMKNYLATLGGGTYFFDLECYGVTLTINVEGVFFKTDEFFEFYVTDQEFIPAFEVLCQRGLMIHVKLNRFIPKFPELADNTLQMLTYKEIQRLPAFATLFPNGTLTITI